MEASALRGAAARYKAYADRWRAEGREEDADAMDEVVKMFEDKAKEVEDDYDPYDE